MPPCGQCNSGTAETASVLYLTHPVLSRPFLRFLKNFPAAACGRQTLNAQREVARQGRRGSDGSPVRTFGWVPPAGSFLSRQEAPQECGLREALSAKPPSLRNPSRPQNQYNLCAAFRRVRGAIPKFFPVRFNEKNQIFGHFLFEYPIARVFHASVRTGAE